MTAYIKVIIATSDAGTKDLLTALLSGAGFDGFEEEPQSFAAFITETAFNEIRIKEILDPLNLVFTTEYISPINWNEEWEKGFAPVVIDDFCCVRASFHHAVPGVKFDIIITPRMSFGTGHHATTFLMIQQMQGLQIDGLNVLDFGTGTGVLAILAEKLGARNIYAIDNDEWSIENAHENIIENSCTRIDIEAASRIETEHRFDLILANINRNVLLSHMDSLAQHLNPNGVLLMSGLLTGDRDKIEMKAKESGLSIVGAKERDGWIVLRLILN